MRSAHAFRGDQPLPRSDRKIDPMRLLGYNLNLIELELDGGFAAKHLDNHADRIVFDVDALHSTGEGTQRAVQNPNGIANRVSTPIA